MWSATVVMQVRAEAEDVRRFGGKKQQQHIQHPHSPRRSPHQLSSMPQRMPCMCACFGSERGMITCSCVATTPLPSCAEYVVDCFSSLGRRVDGETTQQTSAPMVHVDACDTLHMCVHVGGPSVHGRWGEGSENRGRTTGDNVVVITCIDGVC